MPWGMASVEPFGSAGGWLRALALVLCPLPHSSHALQLLMDCRCASSTTCTSSSTRSSRHSTTRTPCCSTSACLGGPRASTLRGTLPRGPLLLGPLLSPGHRVERPLRLQLDGPLLAERLDGPQLAAEPGGKLTLLSEPQLAERLVGPQSLVATTLSTTRLAPLAPGPHRTEVPAQVTRL